MTKQARGPIGVVLAGGAGRRIGGSKAIVELHGRPLIDYPLAVLGTVLDDLAVLARADTALPSMPGVTLWIEPEAPRHPVVGIARALEFAEGRPALVCAADMPLVSPALIERLLGTDPGDAAAIVPVCDGTLEPLLALYLPGALDRLSDAAREPDRPLREYVAALEPLLLELDDPTSFFNVNSPEDLLQAAGILDGGTPSWSVSEGPSRR